MQRSLKEKFLRIKPRKYFADPAILTLNHFERGVLLSIQLLMQESEQVGLLVWEGTVVKDETLRRALKLKPKEFADVLKRLKYVGKIDRCPRTGALRCPEMVKSFEQRIKNFFHGIMVAGSSKLFTGTEYERRRNEVRDRLAAGESIDMVEAITYITEARKQYVPGAGATGQNTTNGKKHDYVYQIPESERNFRRVMSTNLPALLEAMARPDSRRETKLRRTLPEEWVNCPLEMRVILQAAFPDIEDSVMENFWQEFRAEALTKTWQYSDWRKAFRMYIQKQVLDQ